MLVENYDYDTVYDAVYTSLYDDKNQEGTMVCYAYLDKAYGFIKFGDHFVPIGSDVTKHTLAYIRTQFPRKYPYFDNAIKSKNGDIIYQIWNVTEYSKVYNKCYPHSHIDDQIRDVIGNRAKLGSEYHDMDFKELCIKVNVEISITGKDLPEVELSTYQYDIAETLINRFKMDDKVIVLEACPRLGKTLTAGAIFVTLETELTIIASYVKTVFTSFAEDLTSFKQFSDHVHVNMNDSDYENQINKALSEKKKVVAYLSTNQGTNRQKRIDFLFNTKVSKLLIIDEADFGSKRENQAKPLVEATKANNVPTLIMTGTNADQASIYWDVDFKESVVYPELLIQRSIVENS